MPSVSLKYTPDLAYPLSWLQFIPDSWDISRTTPVLLFLAPGTIASAGGLFYTIVSHAAAGVCLIGAVVIAVAIFWIEATLEKMTAAWLILRVERRLARDLRPRAISRSCNSVREPTAASGQKWPNTNPSLGSYRCTEIKWPVR
jgi:hypothetical protein